MRVARESRTYADRCVDHGSTWIDVSRRVDHGSMWIDASPRVDQGPTRIHASITERRGSTRRSRIDLDRRDLLWPNDNDWLLCSSFYRKASRLSVPHKSMQIEASQPRVYARTYVDRCVDHETTWIDVS